MILPILYWTAYVLVTRLGTYELHPSSRELYKFPLRVKLRRQRSFQILNLLVDHPGEVMTREQLHQQLWSSDTFVDFERGLKNSIRELRAMLGDSPSDPRYIETLAKLGYRFERLAHGE
jgi:DNA-binding winged helix-turn-helix (wHTH) protein